MSIDMTGLKHLGAVGLEKVFTEIPKGKAKEGIHFAFKIKKAQWVDGKYGHRYHLDVVVRALDMSTVLSSAIWKVYPSMLPQDIIDAIDCDIYDDTWWLVRTVVNPRSKAQPPSTMLYLIDTQQGLDAASGPSKPSQPASLSPASLPATADSDPGVIPAASERGQPREGEDRRPVSELDSHPSPSTPCHHESVFHEKVGTVMRDAGFYCKHCLKRVG